MSVISLSCSISLISPIDGNCHRILVKVFFNFLPMCIFYHNLVGYSFTRNPFFRSHSECNSGHLRILTSSADLIEFSTYIPSNLILKMFSRKVILREPQRDFLRTCQLSLELNFGVPQSESWPDQRKVVRWVNSK